jgi:hypothetical protein
MTVKRLGRATIEDIQAALVDIRVYPIGKWSGAGIADLLKQLQTVSVHDGSIEAFVVTDGSGHWSVNGV